MSVTISSINKFEKAISSAIKIFGDNFEAGSAVGWTSVNGIVDTYANLGIAAPIGGGTYGLQLASTKYVKFTPATGYPEVWMTCQFRTGASASTRTQISDIQSTVPTTIATFRFSNAASPKVDIWNAVTSETYTGTNTFSASTWYQYKMRIVISATVGIMQVWVDAGAGYVLEIDQQNINTGAVDIGRLWVGSQNTGQTGYADNVNFYESNPD